jgi:plasmid stabilization system protein ParE
VKQFDLTAKALRDLQDIWEFLSKDSFDNADRCLEDFYRAFGRLAEMPGMGHRRADLTSKDVLFWKVSLVPGHLPSKFEPSYDCRRASWQAQREEGYWPTLILSLRIDSCVAMKYIVCRYN